MKPFFSTLFLFSRYPHRSFAHENKKIGKTVAVGKKNARKMHFGSNFLIIFLCRNVAQQNIKIKFTHLPLFVMTISVPNL